MHANKFTKFKYIVCDARVFPGIWFDIFFLYVAADKNKIYSPILL